MPDATYSGIEISVKAKADVSALDKTKKSLNRLGESAKKESNAFDRLSDNMKKHTGALNKVSNSLARIAMYRALRSVIKAVTDAFREGTEHVYRYSEAIGGRLATSLDSIATNFLYLKNSIGAAAAPLINILAPVIDFVIGKLVDLLNVLNQVIAIFSGATTWTKAIRTQKKFMETTATGASKAAKEIHKLGLAQLDELTILKQANDNNSSGGGVGTPDYASMFEEAQFNKKLQELVGKIKLNFNDVLFKWDNLTGEDIAKKALTALTTILFGVTGFAIGGPLGALVGTFIGFGFSLLIDSVLFNNDGVLSTSEVGEMLCAALYALVGGIIGFSVGGIKGAAIGATVGLSLFGAIKTYEWLNEVDSKDSMVTKLLPILSTLGGAVLGFKLGGFTGAAIGALIGLGIGLGIQELIFTDNTQFSATDLLKLLVGSLTLIGGLIGLKVGGPGGALVGMMIGFGLDFTLDSILFADKSNWTSGDWIRNIVAALAPAAGAIIGLAVGGPVGAAVGATVGLGIHWLLKTDPYMDGRDTADGYFHGIQNKVYENNQNWFKTNVTDPITNWFKNLLGIHSPSAVFKTFGENTMQGFYNGIEEKMRSVQTMISTKINTLKGLFNFEWSFPEIKIPYIKTPHVSWSTTTFMGMSMTVPKIDWYAQGGFPDTGSLFIANEAGPEMVGSLGGRTAVANNDQIVEGIQQGVYQAMMSAMSNGSFTADVYLDGKRITDSVVQNINSQIDRTGYSPING